jgi:hypothetical protein
MGINGATGNRLPYGRGITLRLTITEAFWVPAWARRVSATGLRVCSIAGSGVGPRTPLVALQTNTNHLVLIIPANSSMT